MEFQKITEVDQIGDALIFFEECFPHLREKVPDFTAFAKKLSDYAEVYLMLVKSVPVGITCFYANDEKDRSGYITLIGVKSICRRNGLGRELLSFSEKIMRERGMRDVSLEVDKDNQRAIGFYEHMGFALLEETEKSFYMKKEIAA